MKYVAWKLLGIAIFALSLPVEGLAHNGTIESFTGNYTVERSTDVECSANVIVQNQGAELVLKGDSPSWTLHVSGINRGPTFQRKLDTSSGRWMLLATETVMAFYPNRTEIFVLSGPVKSENQPLRRGSYHRLIRYRTRLEISHGEFTTDTRGFLELHWQKVCFYK